jgi:hypothetical protein
VDTGLRGRDREPIFAFFGSFESDELVISQRKHLLHMIQTRTVSTPLSGVGVLLSPASDVSIEYAESRPAGLINYVYAS